MLNQSIKTLLRRCTALLGAVALVVSGCGGSSTDKFGMELFDQQCAVCHGGDGGGSPGRPAINSGSNAASLTDDQIRGVLNVGPGAMPSFKRLTPEQIESLIAYVRQLQASENLGN